MPENAHTFPQGFAWDEAKRRTNLVKHGIDFRRAARVFDGRIVEQDDLRRNYGERRRLALGQVGHTVLLVVYTERKGVRRLISARKANRNERRSYDAGISPGPR